MKSFVDRLFQEINGNKEQKIISQLESSISKQIEETINYKDFFNLPIFHILNIVENANLKNIDDPIEFIKQFITNTVEKHSNERETLCLLFSLQTQDLNLEYQEIIKILQLFSNSQLCTQLGKSYDYQSGLPDVDVDYLLKEKDDQIKQLKEQIDITKIVTKQPKDYEPDIYKAISEGKLSSVKYYCFQNKQTLITKNDDSKALLILSMLCNQLTIFKFIFEYLKFAECSNDTIKSLIFDQFIYLNYQADDIYKTYIKTTPRTFLPFYKYLIEEKGINLNQRSGILSSENPPIIAPIMQNDLESLKYFIEQCNVDFEQDIMLAFTCTTGNLDIAQYLLEYSHFDITTKLQGKNLLHYACMAIDLNRQSYQHLPLVMFLVEKCQIDVNSQCDDDGNTPLHYAKESGFDDVAEYLISKGADQNIKNNKGQTPNEVSKSNNT